MLDESLYEKPQLKVTSFPGSVTFMRSGGLSSVKDKLDWHEATRYNKLCYYISSEIYSVQTH